MLFLYLSHIRSCSTVLCFVFEFQKITKEKEKIRKKKRTRRSKRNNETTNIFFKFRLISALVTLSPKKQTNITRMRGS